MPLSRHTSNSIVLSFPLFNFFRSYVLYLYARLYVEMHMYTVYQDGPYAWNEYGPRFDFDNEAVVMSTLMRAVAFWRDEVRVFFYAHIRRYSFFFF